MNVTKEDAQAVLAMAWRGVEAEREWNQSLAKGRIRAAMTEGTDGIAARDWALEKNREFEKKRERYYEIRDKWFPKKSK